MIKERGVSSRKQLVGVEMVANIPMNSTLSLCIVHWHKTKKWISQNIVVTTKMSSVVQTIWNNV